jgi:hypothetical protein
MTTTPSRSRYPDTTKRATASVVATFAGVMLLTAAVFQVLQGISAVAKDDIYVTTLDYAFDLDVTTWGWIHIGLGILGGLIAVGILTNQTWARVAGIAIASISAINSFLFLPYYPVWALVILAFDVFVMWALCFQLTDPDEY